MDSLFGSLSGFCAAGAFVQSLLHQDWRFSMAAAIVFSLWSLRISLSKRKGLEAK